MGKGGDAQMLYLTPGAQQCKAGQTQRELPHKERHSEGVSERGNSGNS